MMVAEQASLWEQEPAEPSTETGYAPLWRYCAICGWLIEPRESQQTICARCAEREHDQRYTAVGNLPVGTTWENGFHTYGTMVLKQNAAKQTTLVQRVGDAAHWIRASYRVIAHEPARTEAYALAQERYRALIQRNADLWRMTK